MAKAFAFISLPFVLAEAMTGIISRISGELRIPPYFDVGMAVDLVILLVGLGVAVPTVLKARQSKVEISSEPKSQ